MSLNIVIEALATLGPQITDNIGDILLSHVQEKESFPLLYERIGSSSLPKNLGSLG